MVGSVLAVLDWLGTMFNLNCYYFYFDTRPKSQLTSGMSMFGESLESYMGTLFLIVIYCILYIGINYCITVFSQVSHVKSGLLLPDSLFSVVLLYRKSHCHFCFFFFQDDPLGDMIHLLQNWSECSSMDNNEFHILRLSLRHPRQIEHLLEDDVPPHNTYCQSSHQPMAISTFSQTNQEQVYCRSKALSLPGCENHIRNPVALKRWRRACAIIRTVGMLLPARLKTSNTPASPQAKPKPKPKPKRIAARKATSLLCFPTYQQSSLMLSAPHRQSIMMHPQAMQRLEAHVRRKSCQRLWGFPNLVIKYVGDHVVQLACGDGKPLQNTTGKLPWQLWAQSGLCSKRRAKLMERLQKTTSPTSPKRTS
ncbi:uncharacterized protein LOC134460059 isoform X1 [Engraulis encrasicolus]|uniref:uncharacterized protein LOC134460059 isoform X1 n=1 Tax=Engraulis encrasicolus TaxID=184585 RepID=UPI002FD30A4D